MATNDEIDQMLADADAAIRRRREELPLRIRPLMPNVHHISGDHRGEPGPRCQLDPHPADNCPGDTDG